MIGPLWYNIARPFASLIFYRNYVINQVAQEFQEKHPGMSLEAARGLAYIEMKHNRIPALDPAGNFRPLVEKLKKPEERKKMTDWTGGAPFHKIVLAAILGIFCGGPFGLVLFPWLLGKYYKRKKRKAQDAVSGVGSREQRR